MDPALLHRDTAPFAPCLHCPAFHSTLNTRDQLCSIKPATLDPSVTSRLRHLDIGVNFASEPRSGELRMQILKSHLVRTQNLNVLPFKPGVGQYIAIYATLTAREFFLAYFYPSSPFTCIFPKPLPICSCVGLQNKTGHPAGYRFLC